MRGLMASSAHRDQVLLKNRCQIGGEIVCDGLLGSLKRNAVKPYNAEGIRRGLRARHIVASPILKPHLLKYEMGFDGLGNALLRCSQNAVWTLVNEETQRTIACFLRKRKMQVQSVWL